ncbi:O-antigen ligase family protein [Pontibacter liquoris]|uniref:O-antigen ligase family protein n=1 Tax=Pontibacter liquoris TaxID=2905677 RepID=UPI001FA7ED67|nr:O-antigen ligase family protein [Pontibacter liquoris]
MSANKEEGLRYLILRSPLLVFPLSIGFLQLTKAFKEKVLLSFAAVIVIFCIGCLIYSIYQYFHLNRTDVFFNDYLTQAVRQQSVYVALTTNFSLFILAYFIFFRKVSYKALMLAGLLFLFAFSFLLASRVHLLILLATTTAFGFYYILSKKKYLEGFTLLLSLVMCGFLVTKMLPQTLNRFRELTHRQFNYESKGAESHYAMKVTADQWNGANFRLAAWNCGLELFKANPIQGVGLGDKYDALERKYREKNFYFAIETGKNVHSNYIDILYSLGLLGFLLFLIAWVILPLYSALSDKNLLVAVIFCTFFVAWISENYLDRTYGGMLVGFFIPFLLTDNKKGLL